MEKQTTNEIMEKLERINWDFSDFISTKYPYDLNSIPWYPATFISPIPRLLVASLSKQGDVVLDPFGGKGTTAMETILQNRVPLYCDLNPFISENTEGLFAAIEYILHDDNGLECEKEKLDNGCLDDQEADNLIEVYGVNREVLKWFHKDTVYMLLKILKVMNEDRVFSNRRYLIRKLAFSSILKSACSQSGHFTYVTDNCAPKELKQKDAIQLYSDKIDQILRAAKEFVMQYSLSFPNGNLGTILSNRKVINGDAKDLSWIEDDSVDLVITSPPYLCSQDYIKTMRLVNMFCPNNKAFKEDVKKEIGARATRYGKSETVVPKFYSDLEIVFNNIQRVLKKQGYFALVIGQGKSKITSGYNIVSDLLEILEHKLGFQLVFQKERQIGSRVIQVGGVDKESVLILQNCGGRKE